MIRFIGKRTLIYTVASLCCASMLAFHAHAESESPKPVTVTIPTETVSHVLSGVLPFEIPMGKNFTGALWIQTIEKLEFGKDSVTFFMRVLGKDIEFSTKIGSQSINLKFGQANVSSNCEASFRYDTDKKLLLITPRIREFIGAEKAGQAGEVMMPLLEGLSNIEYAIDLKKIDPLKAELPDKMLLVHLNIMNINSDNNQLYIKITPNVSTSPKKNAKK